MIERKNLDLYQYELLRGETVCLPKKDKLMRILLIVMAIIIIALGSYITVDIFTPKVAVSGTDSSANITENVAVTDENVDLAIQALRSKWKEIYEKGPGSEYLEIYHTRVLTVDPDRLSNTVGKEKVKFIVAFDLYSDWYSTAPCYINKGLYNNVINYDDGTTEIATTVVMMF